MKSQAYRMALLYDFYGDVLTPRQKEFYDLYYNEDLSLAEIAENNGITRQGVRDVIVRAEAILTDLEDKTGLIKRFHAMQKQLQEVETAAHDGLLDAVHDTGKVVALKLMAGDALDRRRGIRDDVLESLRAVAKVLGHLIDNRLDVHVRPFIWKGQAPVDYTCAFGVAEVST